MNVRLNPGGIIGVVALVVVAAVVAVVNSDSGEEVGRIMGGFGAGGVFFGAIGGNFLWDRLFGKKD